MPKREAAKYQIKGNSESSSGIKRARLQSLRHIWPVLSAPFVVYGPLHRIEAMHGLPAYNSSQLPAISCEFSRAGCSLKARSLVLRTVALRAVQRSTRGFICPDCLYTRLLVRCPCPVLDTSTL